MNQADTRTSHGLSDLHIAVISGQASRVSKILIENNKKELIDAGDADGTTPLMTAVLTGRQTIAQLLLRNGASAHVRDYRGHPAVDYARSSQFKQKLDTYRRLGLPEVGPEQRDKRVAISKVLRYPAALESWSVSCFLRHARLLFPTPKHVLFTHFRSFVVAEWVNTSAREHFSSRSAQSSPS